MWGQPCTWVEMFRGLEPLDKFLALIQALINSNLINGKAIHMQCCTWAAEWLLCKSLTECVGCPSHVGFIPKRPLHLQASPTSHLFVYLF